MKKIIFSKLLFAIAFIIGLISCDDREMITVSNVSAPKIVDLSAQTLILDSNFPKNSALTVYWDPGVYTAPTEIKYKLEVSSDEAFTKPVELSTLEKSIRNITYTVEQMNSASASVGLEAGVAARLYMRVSSYLGSGLLSATSDVTSITITPYKLSYPDFYIVGAASYVGWDAGNAQIFNKQDNLSVLYTYLESGQNFRFLGQQGWDPINYSIDADGIKANYKYFKQVSSNISKANGDEENMAFSGTTGIYKVVIDATTGVQSLTATASPIPGFDFPEIYLVGNIAGNGWTPENGISMTKTAPGVFEFSTTLGSGTEFKIIGQKSWGDLDWGNISANGNSGFLGPKGDNGNITFDGDGGTYKITVNLKAGIYTIKK